MKDSRVYYNSTNIKRDNLDDDDDVDQTPQRQSLVFSHDDHYHHYEETPNTVTSNLSRRQSSIYEDAVENESDFCDTSQDYDDSGSDPKWNYQKQQKRNDDRSSLAFTSPAPSTASTIVSTTSSSDSRLNRGIRGPRTVQFLKEEDESTIDALQTKIQRLSVSYEQEISSLQSSHDDEINDIFSKLDDIETEYTGKLSSMDSDIREKEAIISALGKQLSDAQRTLSSVTSERDHLLETNRRLEEESTRRETALAALQVETDEKIREERERMTREKNETVAMVERRVRMAAEEQFEEANRCYMALREEHEGVLKDVMALKEEVDRGEELRKAMKAREGKSVMVVTQLKADLATANAQLATNAAAVEAMEEREHLLQSRLKESREQCNAAHMSLANVVREKEQLSMEVKELKGICEELMAMVEKDGGL